MGEGQPVKLVTHIDIIGAIHDQIVCGNLFSHCRIVQQIGDGVNDNMGIDGRQLFPRRIHFTLAYRGVAMQRLALQVGYRNGVEIEQRKLPHARRRQILAGRAAQPTKPDDQHPCGFQTFLAFKIKAAQYNLTVVAHHLLVGELFHG